MQPRAFRLESGVPAVPAGDARAAIWCERIRESARRTSDSRERGTKTGNGKTASADSVVSSGQITATEERGRSRLDGRVGKSSPEKEEGFTGEAGLATVFFSRERCPVFTGAEGKVPKDRDLRGASEDGGGEARLKNRGRERHTDESARGPRRPGNFGCGTRALARGEMGTVPIFDFCDWYGLTALLRTGKLGLAQVRRTGRSRLARARPGNFGCGIRTLARREMGTVPIFDFCDSYALTACCARESHGRGAQGRPRNGDCPCAPGVGQKLPGKNF
jgi:hypothetical protein